jgi:site-specific DNA-cytosine methylase
MMGFPEGWTAALSRTARLRCLGNAVVVQVGEVAGVLLRELAEATDAVRVAS